MSEMRHATIVVTKSDMHFFTDDSDLAMKLAGGSTGASARVGRIEPVSLLLRTAFTALRYVFGDEGWIADWTRSWDCRWRVNLTAVGDQIYYFDEQEQPFANRKHAVAFEQQRVLSLVTHMPGMLVDPPLAASLVHRTMQIARERGFPMCDIEVKKDSRERSQENACIEPERGSEYTDRRRGGSDD